MSYSTRGELLSYFKTAESSDYGRSFGILMYKYATIFKLIDDILNDFGKDVLKTYLIELNDSDSNKIQLINDYDHGIYISITFSPNYISDEMFYITIVTDQTKLKNYNISFDIPKEYSFSKDDLYNKSYTIDDIRRLNFYFDIIKAINKIDSLIIRIVDGLNNIIYKSIFNTPNETFKNKPKLSDFVTKNPKRYIIDIDKVIKLTNILIAIFNE